MALLAGTGVLRYHDATKLISIAALGLPFGVQNATARRFGIRVTVAPVIALAAAVVAVSLTIFRFGPAAQAQPVQ